VVNFMTCESFCSKAAVFSQGLDPLNVPRITTNNQQPTTNINTNTNTSTGWYQIVGGCQTTTILTSIKAYESSNTCSKVLRATEIMQDMEYRFNLSSGLITQSVVALTIIWIANVLIKGWRARRIFVKFQEQGLVLWHPFSVATLS